MTEFDLHEYRRRRNHELELENAYLAGERDRLERILAILLLMAARTANCDPMLILDACCTIDGTVPSLAEIHQPSNEVAKPEPAAVDRTAHVAA